MRAERRAGEPALPGCLIPPLSATSCVSLGQRVRVGYAVRCARGRAELGRRDAAGAGLGWLWAHLPRLHSLTFRSWGEGPSRRRWGRVRSAMSSASPAWEGAVVPPSPALRLQCQPALVPSPNEETSRTSFKISTQLSFCRLTEKLQE